MTSPAQVLADLQEKAPRGPGRAYRGFAGPDGLTIRAFVDGESRLPGIGFRVLRGRVPPGMQLPNIRGADIVIMPGGSDHSPEVTYELRCADMSLMPVFRELAASLVIEAGSAPTAEEGLLCVARRVVIWARFFDQRGADGLARSRQLGLIGELECLLTISDILGAGGAIAAWTGPTGTPHDFQDVSGAVEVKLTTSAAPERVRITSERQLDESVVPRLLMYAILAQEAASGKVSLESLVDQVRSAADKHAPASRALFEERLLAAGYSDVDRARYTLRLTLREKVFLHVRGDFPRIVPSDLRPGVFGVSYDIPWSGVAPFRLTELEVRSMLGDK